jgi:hypothetical protein
MHERDEILLPDGRSLPYRRPDLRPVVLRPTPPSSKTHSNKSRRDRRAKRRGPEQPGRMLDVET